MQIVSFFSSLHERKGCIYFLNGDIFLAMGFDSMTGLMLVHFSVSVGASAAFLNPYNVGVGQALADIPMMSGIGVRILVWFVMMTATAAYIMRYAFKVKANPMSSICYEKDIEKRKNYDSMVVDNLEGISFRGKLVLLLVFAGLALIVYGVLKKGWWFTEIASVFLYMGIIIPLIGGLSINDMSTMAGVDFFGYLKEAGKFVLLVYIPLSIVALILMTVFNFA